jgi:L-seryl-tRNA(Ser) seleniumtransferase
VLCGKRELVEAAAMQGFIGFETTGSRSFGRPLKLDRQEIIAVVVALQEWMALDHDARVRGYERLARTIADRLNGLRGVDVATVPSPNGNTRVEVTIRPRPDGTDAASVARALWNGNPAIRVGTRDDTIVLQLHTVTPGDEAVIADRLRAILA